MSCVRGAVHNPSESDKPITIRTDLRPGDIGQIIYWHGVLYGREHGLDYTLEAYVAESLAEFVLNHGEDRQRLWIASRNSTVVGSVGVVPREGGAAQLRWFWVHPECRRQGLGHRLLELALGFARKQGFSRLHLWTFSELEDASRLYREAGFVRTKERTQRIWGRRLTEERYDLVLEARAESRGGD